MNRPDVYRYHDYREYLKDWLAFKKSSQSRFSLRLLSKQAGLASGLLPMILSGARPLTSKTLARLLPILDLSAADARYFKQLVTLGSSDSQEARLEALDQMRKSRTYQNLNPKETEVYRYLTRWYYVAIREMASLKGFKKNPEWIQSRLREHVPLGEIKEAVRFLDENGYLSSDKTLDCMGGVYKIALTEFHQEMLERASRSIENTPSSERNILGHTFALKRRDFDRAREIINETLEKLRELSADTDAGDDVYHAELALFPVTQGVPKK